jgi:sugar-specific transcriptional regulator TrmB
MLTKKLTLMEQKFINMLLDLGLSENESKVYLGMVALGPSTASAIARRAGIKRTTVYPVISALAEKGLARSELKGWKKLFAPESPGKLANIIDLNRERYRSMLPDFLSLYQAKDSGSSIKYYEGLGAIKSAYELVLTNIAPKDEYLVLSDTEKWAGLDPFFEKFVERRAKLPLKVRLLLQDTPKARHYQKFQANYNFTVKLLPPETKLTTNMNLTSSRLLIHQLHKPLLALLIENSGIIRMHREMFEIMWRAV